jgi:hypothetical protein
MQVSITLTDPECLRKVEEVLVPMIGPVAKSVI